jgi:stage II sporulation protein D
VTPALLALVPALLFGSPSGRTIEVELLSSRPCQALALEGPPGRHDLAVVDGHLLVDGRRVDAPLRLPRDRWTIRLPSQAHREIDGALEFRADARRLRVVARLDLEDYVAWTVASETDPETPREALRAQAVAARSYALAAGRRHADVDLCDLAHCQLLRGGLAPTQLAAGHRAAESTRGEVLRLDSGTIALAPFHAACGGHTGDPSEIFGGAGTGAAAVPDDGCPARPWRALVPEAVFEAVVAERLGVPAPPDALDWSIGAGGYVVQVRLADRVVGGEAFARALDARLGHRMIRSARFSVTRTPRGVVIEGTGIGHGVGLCQAGAARLAAAGLGYREILRHYFPNARIVRLDRWAFRVPVSIDQGRRNPTSSAAVSSGSSSCRVWPQSRARPRTSTATSRQVSSTS